MSDERIAAKLRRDQGFYTMTEVAEMAGIDPKHFSWLVGEGRIEKGNRRKGKKRYYTPDQVASIQEALE